MVNRVLSSRDASQDDPLAVKMAEGMRSTSAREVRVKDIGNKKVQGHGLHFHRDIGHGFTLNISLVKAPKRDRSKIDLPKTVIDLFQANLFTLQQV